MKIEAVMPDGAILEFPEGTPDAVIDSAAREYLGGAIAQPEGQVEEQPVSRDTGAMDIMYQGLSDVGVKQRPINPEFTQQDGNLLTTNIGSGLNKGIADVVGLPVDAVTGAINYAASKLGAEGELIDPQSAFGGSAQIREMFKDVGAIKDPQTRMDKFTQRVFESLGAAMGAGGVARGAAGALTEAGKAVSPMLQGYVSNPARMARLEATAGLGGGVGAATMQQVAPGSFGAEVAGEIVGSLGAPLVGMPARVATRAGKRMSSEGRGAFAEGKVGEELQTAIGQDAIPEALQRLEKAEPMQTTAQVLDSPRMQSLEKEAAVADANFANLLEEMQAVRSQDLELKLRNEIQNAARDDLLEARKASEGAPNPNIVIRDTLLNRKAAKKQQVSELAEQIDPNNEFEMDVSEIRASAQQLKQPRSKAEAGQASEVIPSVLDDILTLGRTGTGQVLDSSGRPMRTDSPLELFNEVRDMRSRVLEEIRAEEAQLAPNRRKIGRLKTMQNVMDNEINKYAEQLPEGPAQKYRAMAAARKELADVYESGPVGNVLRKTKFGDYKVEESEIINTFLSGKRARADKINDLEQALGGDANAKQALRDYMEYSLMDKVSNIDGEISPQKLKTFIENNADVLDYAGVKPQAVNAIAAELAKTNANITRFLGQKQGGSLPVMTLPSVMSRFYAVQRGVVSKRFVASEMTGRLVNRFLTTISAAERQALMQRALTDPQVARDLLIKVTEKNDAAIAKRLRGHLTAILGGEDEQTSE